MPGKHRVRGFFRLRTVKAVGAVLIVFLAWVAFSLGQALSASNGGSLASKAAEWARDHYLGPVVTLAESLTYQPPKKGGKPSFSLAVPKGEAAANKSGGAGARAGRQVRPDVPAPLRPLAGGYLPGEGQWRVLVKVHGDPAIYGTYLRDATYTSYVNGIVSMDQRLVKFQLHPGSEDPGPGNWGPDGQVWIPPGHRSGLVATFNGGFKLDTAEGGFYLHGALKGRLANGSASVVYYKNGTMKVGTWGSEVRMTPQVEGVRQNLKLMIDHGRIAPDINRNVISNWGATLGGGYYVWRSGLGMTASGRIIFAYGPALDAKDLAELLKRAGAVEAEQLDINPFWMSFEYYTPHGHPSNPVPAMLLPTQQQTRYRYYSPYSRDFTAVYARP